MNYNALLSFRIVIALLTLIVLTSCDSSYANEYAKKWIDVTSEHSSFMYHHPDVSPDGKYAVYSVSPNDFDRGTVWIRSVESGEQKQLTRPDTTMDRGDVLVKWSPSGDLIGFASDRGGEVHLYTVPVAGGPISRLTRKPLAANSPWNSFFSWAPDGRRIVFSDTRNESENLFIIDVESRIVEQLTQHTGFEVRTPDWSADGASIVYVSNRGAKQELWIYDLASQTEKVIKSDQPTMSYPVWSPDGQWIAFQRIGNMFSTYIIPRDGGAATQVGPGWAYENWGPAWDSDGKHLIYHAAEVVDTPLMIQDLLTGTTTTLLETISPRGWHWASWSPQGTHLTFHQITENAAGTLDTSVYLGHIADKKVQRIARSTLVDHAPKKQAPAWMPDGRHFVATLAKDGKTQLAMIEVDNPIPRILTSTPSHKMEATVSSDGELIAYIAASDEEENIWLYDMVTDEEIQLTFSENSKCELAFSPDNNRIAFTQSNHSTNFDIMSIATEGGDIQQHTRDESWELHPRWVDDETLFYTSKRQEDSYRGAAQVNIRTGQLTHLLSDEEGHVVMPFAGSDVQFLTYQRGWPNGPLVRVSLPAKTTTVLNDGRIGRPLFNSDGTHVAYIEMTKYLKPIIWRENVERIVKPAQLP